MQTYNWPYKNELDITETLSCDVLVLGGGLAGCYAAIAAARRGQSVILVEKGATARSGSWYRAKAAAKMPPNRKNASSVLHRCRRYPVSMALTPPYSPGPPGW